MGNLCLKSAKTRSDLFGKEYWGTHFLVYKKAFLSITSEFFRLLIFLVSPKRVDWLGVWGNRNGPLAISYVLPNLVSSGRICTS